MTKARTTTIELPVCNNYGTPMIQDFFNEVQKRFNMEVNIKNELYGFVLEMNLQDKYREYSKIKRAIELEPSVIEDRKELKRLVCLVEFRNEEIKELKEKNIELLKEVAICNHIDFKEDHKRPVKTEYFGKLSIEV